MGKRMTAQDRRLAIVKAALPLFARKGFAGTTTRELAESAGVSEPLLYRHFPSKEAIYLEIQNFSCQALEPAVRRLIDLEPSTSTLVRLVYYVMRTMVLGQTAGPIEWNTRCRLMTTSFLEDGEYARVLFKTRFEGFCRKLEPALKAAVKAGDAVATPVTRRNATMFMQHLGAYLALVHLPSAPVVDYQMSRQELLEQSVCFALRGMGLTDEAIQTNFNGQALESMFGPEQPRNGCHALNLTK